MPANAGTQDRRALSVGGRLRAWDTSGDPSAAVSVSSVRLGRRPEVLRSPAPLDEIEVLADEHRLPRLVEDFEPLDHDAVARSAGMVTLLAEHERAVAMRRLKSCIAPTSRRALTPPRAASPTTPPLGSRTPSTRRSPSSIARRGRRSTGSWLRPRHDGAMPFQDAAARLLNEALQAGWQAKEAVARVNALFRASLPE